MPTTDGTRALGAGMLNLDRDVWRVDVTDAWGNIHSRVYVDTTPAHAVRDMLALVTADGTPVDAVSFTRTFDPAGAA